MPSRCVDACTKSIEISVASARPCAGCPWGGLDQLDHHTGSASGRAARYRFLMQLLARRSTAGYIGRHVRHAGTLGMYLALSLAAWALVAVATDVSTWWLVLGGGTLVVLAADIVWLSYRVRRDEGRAAAE
jgi:hypothetical protein